jgi:hypothetical protein
VSFESFLFWIEVQSVPAISEPPAALVYIVCSEPIEAHPLDSSGEFIRLRM